MSRRMRSSARMRKARPLRFVLAIVIMWTGTTLIPSLARTEDGYSAEGANACLDCHENSGVMGIVNTKHADFDNPKSPAAQKQCQSCHGPSAKHMSFPLQVANLHFGAGSKVPAATQNAQCLECHSSGERADWTASAHGFEDVLCSQCHSIHQPDKLVPKGTEVVATCTESCHGTLLAGAAPESFSHPIGMKISDSDTLACSTCHNPHGPLESSRCVECHSQAPAVLAQQSEKAKRFHRTAIERGTECIRCHKGIAHPIAPLRVGQSTHTPAVRSGQTDRVSPHP